MANALEFTGDLHGALDALRKTLPITEKLAAGKTDPELTDLFAGSHYFIAVLLSKTGDPARALENYRQAAAIRQPSAAEQSVQRELARSSRRRLQRHGRLHALPRGS